MKIMTWIKCTELENGMWQWEVFDSELGATVGTETCFAEAMKAAKEYWDEHCNS